MTPECVTGSCAVAVSNTDIIEAVVDREEDLELALINSLMDDCQGKAGVNEHGYGEFGRRRHDKERSGIGKRAIKYGLKVENLKRAKVRRAKIVSRSKDSYHAR